LVDLVVLQGVAGATSVIQVDAPDGRSGEIHFNDGRISHALVVGDTGTQALQEMFRWQGPRVREIDRRSDAPRTIPGPWQSVLREALRATKREEAPPPLPEVVSTPAATVLRDKKLLVIDDTELLLVFVEEVLSTAEPTVQIVTASSGLAGVEKAAAEKPDVILLDYSLPDITGDEVCRRLLQDDRTARVPVIMMSGHVPEMLKVADAYENVVAAIPKPFLSTALIELIERTLTDLPKISAKRRKRAKPAAPPSQTAQKQQPRRNGANSGKSQGEAKAPAIDPATAVAKPPADKPPAAAAEAPVAELPSAPAAAPRIAPEPSPAAAPPLPDVITPAPLPQLAADPAAPAPLPEQPPAPPAAISQPPIAPEPSGLTRALVQSGARNAVVLTLPLEVVSMQFSPSLQIRAIRARPVSPTVSIHVLPQAATPGVIPEARFDLSRVKLDASGQIDTIRLAPTTRAIPALFVPDAVSIVGLAVLLGNGGAAIELMPAPTAPMRMQLTALFELTGVELSPDFRVAHLVVRWRGGNMHVTQQPTGNGSPATGLTFETAQVLLDRAGQIAEILLDAPV
jgi:CheY-like chemotaxis protein